MKIFLSYQDIISFGVSYNYLKKVVSFYRNGKSTSWANKKDLVDKRKVLIDIDTIPQRTREKYNIPTSKEYLEQNRIKNEALKTKELQEIKIRFDKAINTDYTKYLHIYVSDDTRVELNAKKHALYTVLIDVLGTKRTTRGLLTKIYPLFNSLEPRYRLRIENLSRNISEIRKTSIKEHLSHGNIGKIPARANHVTDFHRAMIMIYASKKNIYSTRIIMDMVNFEAENKGLKHISKSFVDTHLAKPENKVLVELQRFGEASFENNSLFYLNRQREEFAGDLWVIDGTPVQFYCWNGKQGKEKKFIRLNLFVVIDAFSGKIVGYDVSLSEDRFNVLNALKMAFKAHNHIPTEILHDNFSANKTEEIIRLKEDLGKMGVIFRAARPKNAKDKTAVERFFETFQSTVFKLYDDYLGEGITSKRKNGRPDTQFVRRAMKKKTVTKDDLMFRLSKQISQYNNLSINGKSSPNLKYSVSPKPNVKELSKEEIPFLFWYKKTITIRRCMVQFEVKKLKYIYYLPTNEIMMKYNDTKVDVYYDETDLGYIHLFEKGTNTLICECKLPTKVTASAVGRSEADDLRIFKHEAKKKSFKKHLKDEYQNVIDKGLTSVGLTELTLSDPLSLDKYNVNDKESEDLHSLFCIEKQLDPNMHDHLQNQLPRETVKVSEKYNNSKDEEYYKTLKFKTKEVKIYKPKNPND